MAYPDAAWERAMTIREVMLKALNGEGTVKLTRMARDWGTMVKHRLQYSAGTCHFLPDEERSRSQHTMVDSP